MNFCILLKNFVCRVLRIITQRLPVSESLIQVVSSLHSKVISILLAKKLILESRKVSIIENTSVISKLDKLVKKLYSLFKEKEFSSLQHHLGDLPYMMFLLRRGPLLGPILQHSDDIDYSRCLFLQSSYQVCLRFIDPPFYEIQTGNFICVRFF